MLVPSEGRGALPGLQTWLGGRLAVPLVSGEPVAGTYIFFFFPRLGRACITLGSRCACVCAALGLWCVFVSYAVRVLRGSLLCRVLASTGVLRGSQSVRSVLCFAMLCAFSV